MLRPSADCCPARLATICTRHKSCRDNIAFGTSELFVAIENTDACELLPPLLKGCRAKADCAKSSFRFCDERLRNLPGTQVVWNVSFNDSLYAHSFERWMCGLIDHIVHVGEIGNAEMIVEHHATESVANFSRHSPAFDEAGFGNESMKTKILVRVDEP
jgi:hypothetical protein